MGWKEYELEVMRSRSGSVTPTTTKKALVDYTALQLSLDVAVVKTIFQQLLNLVIRELSQGRRVQWTHVGVFEVRTQPARRAQNPRTLEKVDVPSKRVVRFKPHLQPRPARSDGVHLLSVATDFASWSRDRVPVRASGELPLEPLGSLPLPSVPRSHVREISEVTGQTQRVVKKVVRCCLGYILDTLSQGRRLEFRDFGVFEMRTRAARRMHNPHTREAIVVPSRRVLKFKPGRIMRDRVEPLPSALG